VTDDKTADVVILPAPNGSNGREDDTVNLRRRSPRETTPMAKELVQAASSMGQRFLELEAQVAAFRRVLWAGVVLAVLALVSAGSVLVAGRRGPSSAEVEKMLERVATPLERLERVLDRLDHRLDRLEK